jgi:hypothetical protein
MEKKQNRKLISGSFGPYSHKNGPNDLVKGLFLSLDMDE